MSALEAQMVRVELKSKFELTNGIQRREFTLYMFLPRQKSVSKKHYL